MDVTPGGRDESLVPADQRWGKEVELPKRISLLTQTASVVVFRYVAQVRAHQIMTSRWSLLHKPDIC
jgi:hypothetical protein